MVSDEEIVKGIESLLRQTQTNGVTTLNGVIQQLETKLGLDLSHKAAFITDLLTNPHFLPPPPSSSSSLQQQQQQQQQEKDHFALQHQYPPPQFYNNLNNISPHSAQQFLPTHFALPHHQFLQQFHHPEDVNYRYPSPHQLQSQFHAYPYPQRHLNPNPNPHLQSQGGGRRDGSVVTTTVAEAGPLETKKESASTGTKRRGGPGGLNKVCGVSPELQVIVGEPALPRTQIVKQLWAYIRKHNLQDPSNKRKIICNDELRLVFETDCTDMFKMNKLLAKHIIPLDPTKALGPDSKRLKIEIESATESTGPEGGTEAGPEGGTEADSERGTVAGLEGGTQAGPEGGTEAGSDRGTEAGLEAGTQAGSLTVIISDALARFFGTEEKKMLQSEAIKRVWEYIKVNRLEDDLNPMMVMCDPKLQELFGCKNVSALGISEMLLTHFSKQS